MGREKNKRRKKAKEGRERMGRVESIRDKKEKVDSERKMIAWRGLQRLMQQKVWKGRQRRNIEKGSTEKRKKNVGEEERRKIEQADKEVNIPRTFSTCKLELN